MVAIIKLTLCAWSAKTENVNPYILSNERSVVDMFGLPSLTKTIHHKRQSRKPGCCGENKLIIVRIIFGLRMNRLWLNQGSWNCDNRWYNGWFFMKRALHCTQKTRCLTLINISCIAKNAYVPYQRIYTQRRKEDIVINCFPIPGVPATEQRDVTYPNSRYRRSFLL